MLQKIKLQNFRRFAEATIVLTDGITVINGPNGVGKSTILEAIEWGFYNKTKKDTLLTSIRNKGTENSEVKVTIEFVFNNNKYILERILTSKNSTTATVYDANNPARIYAKGTTGVNDFITQLFGINHQAFTNSFMAKQKEVDTLSNFKAEERKQFFIKLLGLEVIDKIRPEIRRDIRSAKETMSALKGQLPNISLLKEELKEIEKNIKEIEKNKTKIQKSISKDTETLTLLEKDFSFGEKIYLDFLKSHEQLKNLSKREGEIKTLIEKNGKIVEELKSFENKNVNVSDIDKLIDRLEEEREKFRFIAQFEGIKLENLQTIKALKNDYMIHEKNKETIAKELPSTQIDLNEERKKITKKKMLLANLTTQIKMNKQQTEELDSLLNSIAEGNISQCPTCYSSLSGEEAITHIINERKKVNKNLLSLTFQYEQLESSIHDEEKILKENETEKSKYDVATGKINTIIALQKKINEDIEKTEKILENINGKIGNIDTKSFLNKNLFDTETMLTAQKKERANIVNVIANVNKLKDAQKNIITLQEEIAAIDVNKKETEADIKALEFNENKHQKIKEKINNLTVKINMEKEQEIHLAADLKITKNNLKNKNESIEKAKSIKKQVESYKDNIEVNAAVNEIMTNLRVNLSSKIAPKIGEYTSDFLREITDGLYQNILIDENYNIKVIVDDEEWPIAQLSGGEQDVVNLCMRLAISQIILEAKNVPYNMIILDEIFGSQDEERKMAIIDVIGKLKSIFPQIILITHIGEVKDKADSIVNIERKNDYTSIVL